MLEGVQDLFVMQQALQVAGASFCLLIMFLSN